MKKVIIKIKNPTVTPLNNVSTDKFYGVEISYRGCIKNDRSFLMQRRYCEGDFIVVSQEGLTKGNFRSVESSYFDKPYFDLKDTINYIIIVQKDTVYEFDTFKELTQWLTSNNNE